MLDRDNFDISHEYALKVLTASENANCAELARGFQKALKRKLGMETSSIPIFDPADKTVNAETRFDFFFSELFQVAPAGFDSPLSTEEVIDLFERTAANRRDRKADHMPGGEEPDEGMVRMYEDDAVDYEVCVQLLKEGAIKAAADHYHSLDTAARDSVATQDEITDRRFSIWCNEADQAE